LQNKSIEKAAGPFKTNLQNGIVEVVFSFTRMCILYKISHCPIAGKYMKKLIMLILMGVGLAYSLKTYVVEWTYIASGSMEPTLPVNTQLFVNKTAYWFNKPETGDIISFRSPMDSRSFVKRLVAVEGDEVELKDKALWVNGKEVNEPYVKHSRAGEQFADDNFGPYIVPPNTFFVMGDNRDESNDSRNWIDPDTKEPTPFIKKEAVEGKIFGIY
jgi:signal peptidase I